MQVHRYPRAYLLHWTSPGGLFSLHKMLNIVRLTFHVPHTDLCGMVSEQKNNPSINFQK